MRSEIIIFFILVIMTIAFNSCSKTPELGNDIEKWKKWAESSSEGIWENDANRGLLLTEEYSWGGEGCDNYIYGPFDADMSGDTLFIADRSSNIVVCFLLDGTILWKTPGVGSGPGYFSNIGNLAVGSDVIAVCNRSSARVDIFNRFTGEWEKSFPISWPYDVDIAGDTLAIASVAEPELITLYSLNTDKVINTMGHGFWETANSMGSLSRQGNANLNIALENGFIILSSYFQKSAAIFDVSTSSIICRIDRDMPVDRISPYGNASGGITLSVYIVDCEISNNIVYILHAGYGVNGNITLIESEISDISIIDRYNLNGDYLDSIVLPQSVSVIQIYTNNILTVDIFREGVVKLYSMYPTNSI